MATKPQTPKKRRTRYPGFRPCLNHEILEDTYKNPVPEMCPTCFGATARHQVQLVALNLCAIRVLRNKLTYLYDRIEEVSAILEQHIEQLN